MGKYIDSKKEYWNVEIRNRNDINDREIIATFPYKEQAIKFYYNYNKKLLNNDETIGIMHSKIGSHYGIFGVKI